MTTERTLLADYAANGSERAFREVVRRYIDLVYSTAVRLVYGDTHLAEDVAQMVFADLARLARTLSPDVTLGGWLHRRTCHVALSLMRSQRRRQNRERQAAEMNAQQDSAESSFAQVAPLLDEAINQLAAEDRAAITLRFFERRDFRSIGEALGSTEDAAQKRVTRALEKLRGMLVSRGATVSVAGLAAALGAHAVTAAPAGLAVSVSSAALASAAASGGVTLTLLKLMAMTKSQVVVSAVVVAGLGTALVVEHQTSAKLREQNRALQAQVEQWAAQAEPLAAKRFLKPRLPAPRMVAKPASVEPPENLQPTNAFARLFKNEGELPKLSRDQVESYLARNRRSAESLVAAFRLTGDRALLQEAVEKQPNEPRVSFAGWIAAQTKNDAAPEERRQWLDALKQSAPDNALANYLSAQDYFKSGQTDRAVEELIAAAGKSKFQDYSADYVQNVEETFLAAGSSEAEAKAAAAYDVLLPHLAEMRRLSEGLRDLAGLYRQAGDEPSAQAALGMGLDLGRRLQESSGGSLTTRDMVGLGLGLLNRSRRTVPAPPPEQTQPVSTRRVVKPHLPAPRMAATAPAAEPSLDNSRPANLIARLLNGDDSFKLSSQQVETCLQANRRSAESLLAAFRTTENPVFLREAMEKYPNDPRVNFAACFAAMQLPELPPEERRQRLEAFKQSAPDNALANYLSARAHFRLGQTDQAVQELAAASGKSKFQEYSGDVVQNAQEAYRAAGYSEADAQAAAGLQWPDTLFVHLRSALHGVADLASAYRQAGDEEPAQTTLRIGVTMGRQVADQSPQPFMVSDMVGLATRFSLPMIRFKLP